MSWLVLGCKHVTPCEAMLSRSACRTVKHCTQYMLKARLTSSLMHMALPQAILRLIWRREPQHSTNLHELLGRCAHLPRRKQPVPNTRLQSRGCSSGGSRVLLHLGSSLASTLPLPQVRHSLQACMACGRCSCSYLNGVPLHQTRQHACAGPCCLHPSLQNISSVCCLEAAHTHGTM